MNAAASPAYRDSSEMGQGSIHDQLAWLQVDNDGKHQEWHNWLRNELEETLAQALMNL